MKEKIWQLSRFKNILYTVITLIFFTSCVGNSKDPGKDLVIKIEAKRILSGDSILVTVESSKPVRAEDIRLTISVPGLGTKKLVMEGQSAKSSTFHVTISPDMNTSGGFRTITAVAGHGAGKEIAKASYIVGNVIADYAIMINFPDSGSRTAMNDYINQFTDLGGNLVVLHANIGAEKVWGGATEIRAVWPSKVCKTSASPENDRMEMMLNITDSLGLPSLISVSWDLTDPDLPNTDYMHSMSVIIDELWAKYGHHPSFSGFYSYQEGSGTYYAGYIREFCQYVKSNGSGILTMCSPHIDDPLLAGYLAAIDDLDIINYQAPIMTSYRPDNRQMYPNCRVRDITSLSASATRITDKITLSHVEFMGYFENKVDDAYLTGYDNIFNQFPSAASAYGPDGISFFGFFSCIYFNQLKLPEETRIAAQAVKDGIKAYNLIKNTITTEPSHLAVYIPYSDWCVERWQNCITPALDALRQLGLSFDVIPFIPKKGEEILPFYPMNKNSEQIDYLLKNKYIIILSDISGMQETDSEMLEDFVKKGGTIIAFGPRIPYGDRFDREKLWGAKELIPIQASHKFDRISVVNPGRRTQKGQSWSFAPVVSTAWVPAGGDEIASFPDGTASVLSNRYGEGKTYIVTLSTQNAVSNCPDLIRDIIDDALTGYNIQRPFDVYGANRSMDISMKTGRTGYLISAANYLSTSTELVIKPLNLVENEEYILTDMSSEKVLSRKPGSEYSSIPVRVEGNSFIALGLDPAKKDY